MAANGLIVGLQVGIVVGQRYGLNAMPVSTDGPLVYAPLSVQEFDNLGITRPSSLWLCQEASGNIADSVGSLTLTANGTPLYRQTVTGWTRKGLGFNETANQRFAVAAGSGPNPASTSVAWLIYFKLGGLQGGTRRLLTAADGLTTTGVLATALTTAKLRVSCVNVAADGTYVYNDGAAHPCLLVYDRTNSLVRIYTDKEQISGTYNSGAVDASKGLSAAGSGTSFLGNILYGWAASGATAEGYGRATLAALGWPMAY